MAVNLSPVGGVAGQFFDNNGDPLVGGKLYTYAAGTTTPQTTFTSSSGTTANSNPIILNGGGRVPSEIWLTDGLSYKFVLYSSTDQLIGSWDNISGINSNFVNFTSSQEIQTATSGQTVFTLTTMQYQPGTNSLTVYVDGVNQYGPGAPYAYVETNSTTVTFNSGLHVGAEVKFTTVQQATSSATDAAQVSYQPAGTGAVTTNVQAKLRETVSVKDFGAVGDGVTDDTAAIQAAIDAAVDDGAELYFPTGNYFVSSTVSKTLTSGQSVGVVCDTSTVFTASSSFDAGSKVFTFNAPSGQQRFSWRGGKIDGRNRPAGTPGTAPDLLTVSGFEMVLIEGVYFIDNDTRATTSGDSCLFLAGCSDIFISKCIFQGAPDAGVYISRNANGTVGQRVCVTSCTFTECEVGFISKRVYQEHIVSSNFVYSCNNGIVVGSETDSPDLLPGKKAVINGNYLRNISRRGIECRISDDSVVTSNKIERVGWDKDDVITNDSQGILINGSSNCLIASNHIKEISSGTNNCCVKIQERTALFVGSTHASSNNYFVSNYFQDSPLGVREINLSSEDNFIDASNFFENVTVKYNAQGTGTKTLKVFADGVSVETLGKDTDHAYYSDIAFVSDEWSNYHAGTAPNYFNGNLFVGSDSLTTSAKIGAIVGSTTYGLATFANSALARNHLGFENTNGIVGTITTTGTSTAYNTSSDYRLKENLVPISDALTRVAAIPVYRFNFIADPTKTVDGYVAHELADHIPEAVTGEKDAVDEKGRPVYQGIDQAKVVPLLHAAIQDLIKEIDALKAEIALLKGPQ